MKIQVSSGQFLLAQALLMMRREKIALGPSAQRAKQKYLRFLGPVILNLFQDLTKWTKR
jgi:hypothetical protein